MIGAGSLFSMMLSLPIQEPASPAPVTRAEASPPPGGSIRTIDGQRIKEPKKTKHVSPEWPTNARRAGLTGSVVLECVVGLDGRVETVKVLKGARSLADAASVAVRKWRYTTTELDGKPVPVIMTVTVNFTLQAPPQRDDAMAALRDSDPEIRWAGVRWLGRYVPVVAKQKKALESALHDPSELVRQAAQEALANLKAQE
jgi:TonB family protein